MDPEFASSVAVVRAIPAVQNILDVVCKMTGLGFAAIARVTQDKWIACAVLDKIDFGLQPGGELGIETTICNEIRDHHRLVVIDDVSRDDCYINHHTPKHYGFQSYISVPILLKDGSFFGTLCAIDPRPAQLSRPEVVSMFELFAELVGMHIDSRVDVLFSEQRLAAAVENLERSEKNLHNEQKMAELRDQFIAILGHDLRNPLFGLSGGTQRLLRTEQDAAKRGVLTMMTASINRMHDLIENVLDFARGKLGNGMTLQRELVSIEEMLLDIIREISSAHPDRLIETRLEVNAAIFVDQNRLSQVFSNLLGNAISHGDPVKPIRVIAICGADELLLSVANSGPAISPDIIPDLFKPFSRGKVLSSRQGLGLGLFIASEIAAAHNGAITVSSDDIETVFTLSIPSRKHNNQS